MTATGAAPNSVTPNVEVSLDIAAPPAVVYALVSDIASMPRWSPETYRTEWARGFAAPAAGARFRGWNRFGLVRWSTLCEIEEYEPPRVFSFCTRFGEHRGSLWRYTFEESGTGATRLTESNTRLYEPLYSRIAHALLMRGHHESFQGAMRQTLERIRAAAEASA
ncbi:MAG: SRPBCC family protein [Candidatus Dormibacteria bacterium]